MWLEFYQSTMLVWHLSSGLSANSHKITQRSNYAVMERGITQTRWQCLNRRTPSVASCFHWICLGLLLMLVISSMESVECALRNVNLVIEPPAVRRGQHVVLRCMYDLEGAPLYSAKFYRGQLEFYRYTPGEFPNTKVFPFPGIHVDVTSSNATQVLIRNVGFGLSGNFSCEVTADAPLFSTATASGTMQVVELPDKRPQLYTEHSRYEPGDILRANCSTPPSRPRAELKFTINNMVITSSESQFIRTIDNLIASRISLKLQLQGVHFSSVNPAIYNNGYSLNSVYNHGGPRYAPNPGGLVLRCTAQIGDLYQEYKEIELGTPQKDPVPARVTLSSGSSMKNFFSTYFSTSAAVTQRAGSVHLAQITIALVVLLLSRYTLLTQRDSPLAPSFIPRNGQLATAQCKSSENSPFALRLQDTTPMTDLFSKEIINSRHRSEQKFRSCDCDSNTFSC